MILSIEKKERLILDLVCFGMQLVQQVVQFMGCWLLQAYPACTLVFTGQE